MPAAGFSSRTNAFSSGAPDAGYHQEEPDPVEVHAGGDGELVAERRLVHGAGQAAEQQHERADDRERQPDLVPVDAVQRARVPADRGDRDVELGAQDDQLLTAVRTALTPMPMTTRRSPLSPVRYATLQRDFEREFGMPYSRWRARFRLAAARVLLETRPVGEVAHRVGYASTSAFIAAFSKEFGCTPGRTRELATPDVVLPRRD